MNREEVKSLLEHLRAPTLPPKMQAARVRYRFQLENDGRWDLLLNQGRLWLEDTKGPVDCQVECTADEFEALLSGRHNLLTAFMRGAVLVQGTMATAKLLYTFLRYAQIEESKV